MTHDDALIEIAYWAADFRIGVLKDEYVLKVLEALQTDSESTKETLYDIWELDYGTKEARSQ